MSPKNKIIKNITTFEEHLDKRYGNLVQLIELNLKLNQRHLQLEKLLEKKGI